jgi:uncharacterized protein
MIMPPDYGVGVVWWPELDPLCRPSEGLVRVIEAEPETFWIARVGQPSGFTSRLPRTLGHLPQPKLLHGVGAPFGGRVTQPAGHHETLLGDIAAMRPAWISDHLSFNRFVPSLDGSQQEAVCAGFFLPPAQCSQGISRAVEEIIHRQRTTGIPVAFETPVSYLPPRPGEMADGTFAAAVAEAADCGILLDLHNLLCNERNGRQSVADFCEAIPLERVWEIHIAGGQFDRGFWLDAHSGVVEPALMAIVAEIVPRLPALGAIIFEIAPDCVASTGLSAISAVLSQLNDIWSTRVSKAGPIKPRPKPAPVGTVNDGVIPALWEYALGAAVVNIKGPDLPPALAEWMRSVEAALELYRFLAQEGRASALVETAPRTIRSLLRRLGEVATRDLLARFWHHTTPAYSTAEEASAFLDFVSSARPTVPDLLADIASDRCLLNQLTQHHQLVSTINLQ